MKNIFTTLSILLFSTMISTAQNEKIAKFYDTEAGRGYYSIGTDNAYIGDSILIFQMWSDDAGYELWRTNGTATGTYMVKDITTGTDNYDSPLSGFPEYFSAFDGKVYFRATDGSHGFELWSTDGTDEGTAMVKDIYEGGSGSLNPTSTTKFIAYKDELYFAAKSSSDRGFELWKTDGTEAGTVLVKDILSEDGKSSDPKELIVFNDLLFFVAKTNNNNYEIWYTDGTGTGTVRLSNLPDNERPKTEEMMVFKDMLIFKGQLDNGLELWKTDGTEAGTMEIKDINPGTGWGAPYGDKMVELNGELFFKGETEDLGYELWKTDGTEAGTVLVKDINPGMDGSNPYSSTPSFLCVYDNKVFFAARNSDSGTQLWASDGTAEGTVLYFGHSDNGTWSPRDLLVMNNRFYFTLNSSAYGQPYLYSMGSSTETPVAHQAKDFTFKTYERYFGAFFVLKDQLCFQADIEENTGFELYKLVSEDVTGLSELEDQQISMYPNPTTDFVHFDLENNSAQKVNYAVYDISGKQIFSETLNVQNDLVVDLSSFKTGTYVVKINTDKQSFSKTIIRK